MTPTEAKSRLKNYRDKPFRKYQEDAINFIVNSDKRFKVIEAPTGSGKTLIGMTAGVIKQDLTYMVHSKVLQNQVTGDFPEAKSLFGRGNYVCLSNTNLSCDECHHSSVALCKSKQKCVYDTEKRDVINSKLRILNYDYYLSSVNYAHGFKNMPFLIIDEADNLENTLIGFTTLTFTNYAIRKLNLHPPVRKSGTSKMGLEPWIHFGHIALHRVKNEVQMLQDEIDSFGDDVNEYMIKKLKEKTQVVRLQERIQLFINNVDDTWMFDDRDETKYVFRPLWMNENLSEKFMWQHGRSWTLMSASFPPVAILAKQLGIPTEEIDYLQVPSTFPVHQRQIHINPVCNLTAKTMDVEVPKLIDRIGEILDKHENEKGLIHCVSYNLGKEIVRGLNNNRLVIHNSIDRQDKLNEFMQSTEPLVLVSPSMERGVSLEQDLCVHPNTLIRTSLGYKQIKDIVVGDKVFTHRRKFKTVTGVMCRDYDGEIVKIKTYGGKELLITPEHPVLCDKYGNRKPYFHPVLKKWLLPPKPYKVSKTWKPAGDIIEGDSVLLPFGDRYQSFKPLGRTHITTKRKASKTIEQAPYHWQETPEFWELVGLWVAEGSLSIERIKREGKRGQPRIHYTIQFTMGSHERHTLAERCCELIEKGIGNKRPTPRIYGSSSSVTFKNDAFGIWLKKNVGCGAKEKRIPTRLLKCRSVEFKEAFLAGVCNGDGYYNKKSDLIKVGLANEILTVQLRDLALQLGYTASCSPASVSGYDKNGEALYAWTTTISQHENFAKNCKAGYQRTKVRCVSREHYEGKVYNLQVDKDESYTTDTLCVHNCRFIIIAKAPFLNLGDKVVSARVHGSQIGRLWYQAMMLLTVLQMCGRGFRSEDDRCETYILDEQFKRVFEARPLFLPSWWKDAIAWR